jgi:rRNA-processing protein FCF1
MIAPAVSISSESSMIKTFKSIITDCNKKIVLEKCTKYHLNISESPINKIKKNLEHNVDDETDDTDDTVRDLAANDEYYERTIDNSFKRKLRKRSIRSMMLLNFSN